MVDTKLYEISSFETGLQALQESQGKAILRSPFGFGVTVGAVFWDTLIQQLRIESGYDIKVHILDCGDDAVAVHRAIEYKIPIIVYSGNEDVMDLITIAHRYGGKIIRQGTPQY